MRTGCLLPNMGLRGLDFPKIGLVNAIFILLFPLQTGSKPTPGKNHGDEFVPRLDLWPKHLSLSNAVNSHQHAASSAFRDLNTKGRFVAYDGILDDRYIDSKRGVVSGNSVGEDAGAQVVSSHSLDSGQKNENKPGLHGDRKIPPEDIVKLKLEDKTKWNKSTLRQKLSSLFGVPTSNVYLSYKPSTNTIEMYIIKSGDSIGGNSLIPANEVLAKLQASHLVVTTASSTKLDAQQPKALKFKSGPDNSSPQTSHLSIWKQPWFPYVAAGCAAFIIIIILGVVCCYVKYKKRKAAELQQPPQHICLYPVAKPDTQQASTVQPEGQPYYVSGACVTPVPAQPPVRIRAKGLLESRRGSSASLTIDLTPTVDTSKSGSPPKESPSREYLLSAGYRMTRKQLRKCLKNLKPLYDEFWEIPMNHPDRVNVPGSGLKNRYKTILPNEHTRIRLEEIDYDILTTYINANFIRGYAGEEKAYIATQGPISNTVYDFWRMLWQEHTPCVVMITKLTEKNKIKCEQYFPIEPSEGTYTYEDIHVSVTAIAIRDGYEIRELTVTHDGYLNEERKILHFWYTAWPDHKTPDSPKQLLNMVAEVEKKRYDHDSDRAKGPVVVHCSAGIGRTGCFIAISIGVRQLQEEQMIDVLGIVCQMRLDRGGMVQNSEQYEFVHRALCMFEKTLPQSSPSGD